MPLPLMSKRPSARLRRHALTVEALEVRRVLTEPDESMSQATAVIVEPTALADGAPPLVRADVLADGRDSSDVDMFEFTGYAGFELTATTSHPVDSTDTILRLFDASGTELAINDDHLGGPFSQLTFTFTTTGTYYIGVSGTGDSTYDPATGAGVTTSSTGDYNLELTQTSTEQEIVIGVDGYGSELNTLPLVTFQDSFVQSTQTGTLTLTVEAYPAAHIAMLVDVFDQDGTAIVVTDTYPAADRFVASFTAVTGEVYHIRLRNQSDTTTLVALTQVSFSHVAPVDDVPDTDVAAQVLVLPPPGSNLFQNGVIGDTGDVDVYRFTAPDTGVYSIEVVPPFDSGLDAELEIFIPGRPAESVTLNELTRAHRFLSLMAGETVIVRVKGFSDSRGAYELYISRTVAVDVVLDANQRVVLSGTVPAFGPDVYRIVAPADGVIDVTNIAGGATLFIGENTEELDSMFLFETRQVQAGQSVFLMAFFQTGGDYSADVQFSPTIFPTFSPSGVAVATGTLSDTSDSDAYAFVAPTDGFLTIDLDSAFVGSMQESTFFGGDFVFNFLYIPVTAGQTVVILVQSEVGAGGYSVTAEFSTQLDDFAADSRFATPLSAGADGSAEIQGTLETTLDTDTFQFVTPESGTYLISLSALGGSQLDTVLTVNSATQDLLDFSDDSEFSTDSLVSIDLVAGQVIFLEVTGEFPTRGAYQLEIRPVGDDFGDTIATAERLTPVADVTLVQSGDIDAPGDIDVFEIVAPATGRLIVQLNATGLLDPYLTIYDADGDELAADDDSGAELNSLIILNVTAGDRLYLEASAFGESAGEYELHVLVDTTSTVTTNLTVTPGVPVVVSGNIEVPFSTDLFTFRATADGVVTIRQNAADGSPLDPFIQGFINGHLVAVDDDGGDGLDSLMVLAVRAGDEVRIEAGAFPGSSGAYTVEVLLTAQTVVDDVPFDAVETIEAAAGGITVRGGAIEIPQDSDLYRIVLPDAVAAGSVLRIRSTAGDGALDPVLEVFVGDPRSGGVLLAENDDDGFSLNSDVLVTIPHGEVLYVRARGFGATTGAYALRLEFTADDHPNTHTADTLTELVPGTNGVAQVDATINLAGDVDVFKFTSAQSAVVRFRQTSTSGVDPFLRIYNAEGELIAENDDSDDSLNALIELEYEADTTLFVVAGAYGSSIGSYAVSAELLFGAKDDTGNTFSSATTLNITTGSAEQRRFLESATDADVFRFIAPADGTVTITLAGPPGVTLTVFERLESSNSGSQQPPQQIARGAAVNITVEPGREYFIRVSGTQPGAYTLRASFAAGARPQELLSDEEFDALLAVARQAAATSGGDMDIVMDAVMQEFQRLTAGRNVAGTLVAVMDPVDFLVAESGQRANVGFANQAGRVVEVPQARLSQDDTVELVVMPASSTAFQFQLHGVGADFRMAARLVTPSGVTAPRFVEGSLAGTLSKNAVVQVALDFGERPVTLTPVANNTLTPNFISVGTAVQTIVTATALLSEVTTLPITPTLPSESNEQEETTVSDRQTGTEVAEEAAASTTPPRAPIFNVLSEVLEAWLPRLRVMTGMNQVLPETEAEALQNFFGPFWESVERWASEQWSPPSQTAPPADASDLPPPVPFSEAVEQSPPEAARSQPVELPPEAVDAVFMRYAA